MATKKQLVTLVSGIGPWYGYGQAKRIDMEAT
jgi:hypothetical protein